MNGVQKISKNKQKQQQQKLKQSKTKTNLFTMYERLKLICTCKWPIDLSEFNIIIISFLKVSSISGYARYSC
jgi:hypothetical protein